MHPLLRLPCALLALLLSALGASRFAVERPGEGDPGAPAVMALAALPAAQVQIDAPGDWWLPTPLWAPRAAAFAAVAPSAVWPAHADPMRPAPCRRRGSAGGPRAP